MWLYGTDVRSVISQTLGTKIRGGLTWCGNEHPYVLLAHSPNLHREVRNIRENYTSELTLLDRIIPLTIEVGIELSAPPTRFHIVGGSDSKTIFRKIFKMAITNLFVENM